MCKILSALSILTTAMILALGLTGCDSESDPKAVGSAVITIETVTVTATDVTVTFTPNENTVSYAIAIGTEEQQSQFEDGTLTGIENVSRTGANVKLFDNLLPNTKYTVFARGVNLDGINGKTITAVVTTKEAGPAGPAAVGIDLGEVSNRTVTVLFAPNENTVSYSIAVGTADQLSQFEDGSLPGIEKVTQKEEYIKVFTDLEPAAEYMVFARGVNSDGVDGKTASQSFITLLKQNLTLTADGAFGEYYGGWWADNTDLWLHSETTSDGAIINGFALFFESFAPEADDPQHPVIIPGIYVCTDDTMPDEYEFAMGLDDGTGNIRSSQYQEFIDGKRTQHAIIEGNYEVTQDPNGLYTVNVNVETAEHTIRCTYVGEIDVDIVELNSLAFKK